jgi:hypothetical protein
VVVSPVFMCVKCHSNLARPAAARGAEFFLTHALPVCDWR